LDDPQGSIPPALAETPYELPRIPRMRTSPFTISTKLNFRFTEFSEVSQVLCSKEHKIHRQFIAVL
jgi:hypothetical protein